jgi:glutamyl-tRNA synthetase
MGKGFGNSTLRRSNRFSMTVKTRFAPSPTGYVHIGGLRTVLYSYLFAKKHGGVFALRIEDTDRSRYVEGSVENILSVLHKFGLDPDEGPTNDLGNGPYFQSERLPIYREWIEKMLESGHAYYCFCSAERLDALREEQESLKLPTKYDGHCRDVPLADARERVKAGEPYTVRLKVPKAEKIVFNDLIRGRLEFDTNDVDDQVLLKSDGFPTYHGAIVVDDHLMGVTHAFRGEEWISSIPKQVLVARALGVKLPEYAHLPLILGADKKKLSKRTGDVAAEEYLKKGYLVESLLNFLVLLGWNPKTTEEFFTMEEMIERFEISDVHKAGAVFDPEKLDWMNAKYLQKMDDAEVFDRLVAYLKEYRAEFYENTFAKKPEAFNRAILRELKTRLKRFDEFEELTKCFYTDTAAFRPDLLVSEKMKVATLGEAKKALELAVSILESQPEFSTLEALKEAYLPKIAEAGLKNGQALWPVRVALTGEEFSPGAFEVAFILGKHESLKRLAAAIAKLGSLE